MPRATFVPIKEELARLVFQQWPGHGWKSPSVLARSQRHEPREGRGEEGPRLVIRDFQAFNGGLQ